MTKSHDSIPQADLTRVEKEQDDPNDPELLKFTSLYRDVSPVLVLTLEKLMI